MVGAPGPDVVEDRVVGVHDEARRRPAGLGASDAEEHVGEERRIVRVMRAAGVLAADLHEDRRVHRACVDDEARHLDPRHARRLERSVAVHRDQRCEPEPEHHCVRAHDLDPLRELIDARRKDQVLAERERRIDRRHRRRGIGDEEAADRDRCPGHRAARVVRSDGIVLHRRNEDAPIAGGVGGHERRLLRDASGRDVRVLTLAGAEVGRRRAVIAEKDLVPDGIRPLADVAVAGEELLLAEVADESVQLVVGEEPAADEAAVAVVLQDQRAVDDHAAHRRCLRDAEQVVRVLAAAILAVLRRVCRRRARERHVQRHVRERSPEVVQAVARA